MSLGEVWENTKGRRGLWLAALAATIVVVAVFLYSFFSMLGAIGRQFSKPVAVPDDVTLDKVDQDKRDAGYVGLFTEHCLRLWAEATPATLGALRECVTLPDLRSGVKAASDSPATVLELKVWEPQRTYVGKGYTTWSVTAMLVSKEWGADAATMQFLSVPVSLPTKGGPRWINMPDTRARSLPKGVDLELAYNADVEQSSALYGQVSGFLNAFLCGPASPNRCGADPATYISPDIGIQSLGRLWEQLTFESIKSDVAVSGSPTASDRVHVLATVVCSDDQGGHKLQQFALLVAGNATGGWTVAAFDDLPVTTGRTLEPPAR